MANQQSQLPDNAITQDANIPHKEALKQVSPDTDPLVSNSPLFKNRRKNQQGSGRASDERHIKWGKISDSDKKILRDVIKSLQSADAFKKNWALLAKSGKVFTVISNEQQDKKMEQTVYDPVQKKTVIIPKLQGGFTPSKDGSGGTIKFHTSVLRNRKQAVPAVAEEFFHAGQYSLEVKNETDAIEFAVSGKLDKEFEAKVLTDLALLQSSEIDNLPNYPRFSDNYLFAETVFKNLSEKDTPNADYRMKFDSWSMMGYNGIDPGSFGAKTGKAPNLLNKLLNKNIKAQK